MTPWTLLARREPPLDPSAEEGRRVAGRELARPEYHQPRSILEQVQDWVHARQTELQPRRGPQISPVIGELLMYLLLLGLLVLVVVVLLRLRRTPRPVRGSGSLLDEEELLPPEEYRERARAALARGDWDAAYLDAFRALASRSAERTLLEDVPSLTAHEVGVALRRPFPAHAATLRDHADGFDRIHYGSGHATEAEARGALAMEESIDRTRPVLDGEDDWDDVPDLVAPGTPPADEPGGDDA